jgi:hypothetical protein
VVSCVGKAVETEETVDFVVFFRFLCLRVLIVVAGVVAGFTLSVVVDLADAALPVLLRLINIYPAR